MGNRFIFVGNSLWLDFVNTKIVSDGQPLDLLGDFQDLIDWLSAAGVQSSQKSSNDQKALESAREFRDTLRAMAQQVATRRPVPAATIDRINEVLSCKWTAAQLTRKANRFERHYETRVHGADQLLVSIAESVSEFLCEGDPKLLKKCSNKDCILYFYDTTKNHKRRWCSMDACGNRMKVAAYWERKRKEKGE